MKRSLLILSAVAFVLASCKQDRTCECCFSDSGIDLCVSETKEYTKSDAEDWCDQAQAEANTDGVTGITCKLK